MIISFRVNAVFTKSADNQTQSVFTTGLHVVQRS